MLAVVHPVAVPGCWDDDVIWDRFCPGYTAAGLAWAAGLVLGCWMAREGRGVAGVVLVFLLTMTFCRLCPVGLQEVLGYLGAGLVG